MPFLGHDVQYMLECGVEAGDLTGDVETFLRFFADDTNAWYDEVEQSGACVVEEAHLYYDLWRKQAKPIYRAVASARGMLVLARQVSDLSKYTVDMLAYDCRLARKGRKSIRRVGSPKVIRRHLKCVPFLVRFIGRARKLVEYSVMDFKEVNDVDTICRFINRMYAEYNTELRNARWRALKANGLKPRQVKKSIRKTARRSYQLLQQVAGHETARMFVAGDRIELEGRNFNFLVRKNNLMANGHASLAIEIADKNGVLLSNLCFYFVNTPAMDQLIALMMAVHSGEEEDLIRTGNLFSVRQEAHDNELLRSMKTLIDNSDVEVFDEEDDHSDRHVDCVPYHAYRSARRVFAETITSHQKLVRKISGEDELELSNAAEVI